MNQLTVDGGKHDPSYTRSFPKLGFFGIDASLQMIKQCANAQEHPYIYMQQIKYIMHSPIINVLTVLVYNNKQPIH